MKLVDLTCSRREVPFVTVVTDLGSAHPTWFHRDVDACFVPSKAVKKLALKEGLHPSQIRQHGLPIREGFWTEPEDSERLEMRKKLNIKDMRYRFYMFIQMLTSFAVDRTVMIMGGGDGVGKIVKIANAVIEALSQVKRFEQDSFVLKSECLSDKGIPPRLLLFVERMRQPNSH